MTAGFIGLMATVGSTARATVTETLILQGINALKASASNQLAILNALQNSGANQAASLASLQNSATNQAASLAALQNSAASQAASLAALQSSLATLQTNVTALQTAISSLQQAVDSIPHDPRKKYYLTRTPVDGAHALFSCAQGFHMASLWEIVDTSSLEYDTSLGETSDDSGRGPSSFDEGWIRTGWREADTQGFPGSANCDTWTSADASKAGTTVVLNNQWDQTPTSQSPAINPWRSRWVKCDQHAPVWCKQN